MLFDNGSLRERANDQAEGLRQLRRSDSVSQASGRVMAWPRVVLISEFPGTDVGARFAFHLTRALGTGRPDGSLERNLLVDLAPAASRLPQVLADWLPIERFPSIWSELAAGRSLSAVDLDSQIAGSQSTGSQRTGSQGVNSQGSSAQGSRRRVVGSRSALAVAAEPRLTPPAADQLPRLYEQFVRQLSRQGRWGWIVLLALDQVVPLDRACWQAADDIVLIGGTEQSNCRRHAAAVCSRLPAADADRRLWALPQRRTDWRSVLRSAWRAGGAQASIAHSWSESGVNARLLPAAHWPQAVRSAQLRQAARADKQLERSAATVARALRLASGCEVASGDGREDVSDLARLSGSGKKIQLRAQLRPITQLSEVFRA